MELAWYQERLDICARNFDDIVLATRMEVSLNLLQLPHKLVVQTIARIAMVVVEEILELKAKHDKRKFWSNAPGMLVVARVVERILQIVPPPKGDGGEDGEPVASVG